MSAILYHQPEGVLAHLPSEIVVTILANCHPSALLMLARTSKGWRKLVASPKSLKLWENAFEACGLELPFKSDERNLMQRAAHIWLKVCAVCLHPAPASARTDTHRVCQECSQVCFKTEEAVREALVDGSLSRLCAEATRATKARQGDPHSDTLFDFAYGEYGYTAAIASRMDPEKDVGAAEGPPERWTVDDVLDIIVDVHPAAYELSKAHFASSKARPSYDLYFLPALLLANSIALSLETFDCVERGEDARCSRSPLPSYPTGRTLDYMAAALADRVAVCEDRVTVAAWAAETARVYTEAEEKRADGRLAVSVRRVVRSLEIDGVWDDCDIDEARRHEPGHQFAEWLTKSISLPDLSSVREEVIVKLEAARARRLATEQAEAAAGVQPEQEAVEDGSPF